MTEVRDWKELDARQQQSLLALLPTRHPVRNQSFRSQYYGGEYANLNVAINADEPTGIIGTENLQFVTPQGSTNLCFGTNFFAINAASTFALFNFWRKQADFTLTYGGSQDFVRFAKALGYCKTFPIAQFQLNKGPGFERNPWKKTLKQLASYLRPRVNLETKLAHVSELKILAKKVNLPQDTVFHTDWEFSLRATREYLGWRYPVNSAAVTYEWFEISGVGSSMGFVILGSVKQKTFVALVDTPEKIAAFAIAAAFVQSADSKDRHRELYLTTASSIVRRDLKSLGFQVNKQTRSMILCGSKKSPPPEFLWKTSGNVCFDIGDNGLRLFFE